MITTSVRLLLDQRAQAFSHHSVIVGQQNLDAHKTFPVALGSVLNPWQNEF
jgi:hypothetical protein